jgi:transcriptional regulator with XRE-family HTH domain
MSKPTPDTEISQQVGQALQHARLQRGMTQAELGQALGVKRVTVSRWERGERSLDLTTLLSIAHMFHVDPATLLPRTETMRYAQQPPTAPPKTIAERPFIASTEVMQAIELLQQHPDLAESVIDLIETMVEARDSVI